MENEMEHATWLTHGEEEAIEGTLEEDEGVLFDEINI